MSTPINFIKFTFVLCLRFPLSRADEKILYFVLPLDNVFVRHSYITCDLFRGGSYCVSRVDVFTQVYFVPREWEIRRIGRAFTSAIISTTQEWNCLFCLFLDFCSKDHSSNSPCTTDLWQDSFPSSWSLLYRFQIKECAFFSTKMLKRSICFWNSVSSSVEIAISSICTDKGTELQTYESFFKFSIFSAQNLQSLDWNQTASCWRYTDFTQNRVFVHPQNHRCTKPIVTVIAEVGTSWIFEGR